MAKTKTEWANAVQESTRRLASDTQSESVIVISIRTLAVPTDVDTVIAVGGTSPKGNYLAAKLQREIRAYLAMTRSKSISPGGMEN